MKRTWCRAVLMSLACHAVAASAHANPADAPTCTTMPPNVRMPGAMQTAVNELLAHSSVLRRQCAVIAAARDRVRLTIVAVRPDLTGCRARASFAFRSPTRFEAEIDLPFTRDFPELIAHELEHVVEQIEGVNLRRLAAQQASGVDEVAVGTFETMRAQQAGRAAAVEVRQEQHLLRVRAASAPLAALPRR